MTRLTLGAFDEVAAPDATRLVLTWARIPSWADAVVAGRPYADRDVFLRHVEDLADAWTWDDVAGALAAHPRIGERPTGADAESAHSRREQAGVAAHGGDASETSEASDAQDLAARIADANHAYEERFGRVFLIRAAGRSAPEILAAARRRLTHDDETERAETTTQLREIALLRAADTVDDHPRGTS